MDVKTPQGGAAHGHIRPGKDTNMMYLFFLFAAGVAGAFLIMAFAALKRFNHSGPFFAAASLWFIYALYELHAAKAGWDIRIDLLIIWPVLFVASIALILAMIGSGHQADAALASVEAMRGEKKRLVETEKKRDMAPSSSASNEERLILAAKEGDVQTVKTLLEAGTDVNATVQGYAGMTPLMHASRSNHLDCAKVLISAGANVRIKNELGRTALKIAAGNGNLEIVKLLEEAGARVELV